METLDRPVERDMRTLTGVAVLILIVMVLQLAAQAWQIFRGVAVTKQRWQYVIESPRDEDFQKRIQELGSDGWEIVSARRAGSETAGGKMEYSYEMILRRPSQIEDAPLSFAPAPPR